MSLYKINIEPLKKDEIVIAYTPDYYVLIEKMLKKETDVDMWFYYTTRKIGNEIYLQQPPRKDIDSEFLRKELIKYGKDIKKWGDV